MKYKRTRTRITRQDLAQDRDFWRDLLVRRASLRGLPAHSAGSYRNRRFAIIRDAAWITLYRARLPFPQVGVFLRCAGLAGEAFLQADASREQLHQERGDRLVHHGDQDHHVEHQDAEDDWIVLPGTLRIRYTVRNGIFNTAIM